MNIVEPNLIWNGKLQTLYLSKVKHIMLHHTAHPTWDIYKTHSYHKNVNKWIGIGYNFFIEKDGTIEQGRGFNIGAGATGYNSNSIHICFAGNFESQIPTDEQIESGKELVEYLLDMAPLGTDVIGHKDIGKTACPGANFPLEEFKKLKRKEKSKMFEEGQEKEAIDYLVEQGRITNKEQALQKLELIKNECWTYIKWANDVKELQNK